MLSQLCKVAQSLANPLTSPNGFGYAQQEILLPCAFTDLAEQIIFPIETLVTSPSLTPLTIEILPNCGVFGGCVPFSHPSSARLSRVWTINCSKRQISEKMQATWIVSTAPRPGLVLGQGSTDQCFEHTGGTHERIKFPRS